VNGALPRGESLSGKRSKGVPDMWSFSLEGQDRDSISDILSTEDAGSIRKESVLDKLFGNAAPTLIDDVVLPSDLLRDEVTYILHGIPYVLFLCLRYLFNVFFSLFPCEQLSCSWAKDSRPLSILSGILRLGYNVL
jgi:hypothetical protein